MSDGLPPSMTDLLAPPAQPESSVLTEQPQRQVSFLTTGIPAPGDLYVSPQDSIRVELFSQNAGIPALVKMRYVPPSGEIQYEEETVTTVALPATTLQDYPIGEAFLLSVAVVSAQSTTQRGRIYANVSYIRAFGGPAAAYMHTLVQGYVTAIQRVSWPIIQADFPLNGQGLPVFLTLAAPPAGQNFSYTTPANIRLRIMSMQFTLSTSAAVATRIVSIQAQVGGAGIALSGASGGQSASQLLAYACGSSYPCSPTGQGWMLIPWPMQLYLQGGTVIQVNVQSIQSADQLSAIDVAFEEWMDI